MPAAVKRYLAENGINFYIIDAVNIAQGLGMGNHYNMIMQSAFFKLANVMPVEDAVRELKAAVKKAYGKKGEAVVGMNYAAVDKGIESMIKIEVPASWAEAMDEDGQPAREVPDFISGVLQVMNRLEGDKLPVSTFRGREDGSFPVGTSRYEKRSVADFVPHWIRENCIQCCRCSFVCPHAAVRPFLLNAEEQAKAPAGFETKPAVGKELKDLGFRIQVSVDDCMGCGVCAETCPAKEKALVMRPYDSQAGEAANWDYAMTVTVKDNLWNRFSVKGSQLAQPLLEFSGACGGCVETVCCQAGHPVVRRADGGRQRHRLLLHLGRQRPIHALLRQFPGQGPGLGERTLRGQRRIRLRHLPGDPAATGEGCRPDPVGPGNGVGAGIARGFPGLAGGPG